MGKKGRKQHKAAAAGAGGGSGGSGGPATPASKPLKMQATKCTVALLTPTFNRQRFLPYAARCFLRQETKWCKQIYWYILDDSDEPCEDIVRGAVGDEVFASRVRYSFVPLRMTVAEKRNALIDRAYRDGMHIFAAFDDDDWYGPTYVKAVVQALSTSSTSLAGASSVHLYMAGIDKVARTDPIMNYVNKQKRVRECRHTCNGVLCFRRDYWDAHRYAVHKRFAEEGEFCDGGEGPFSAPIIQLENTVAYNLALNHSSNTFDKEQLLDKPNQILKTAHGLRVEEIIGPHDPEFLRFWKTLDLESRNARAASAGGVPSQMGPAGAAPFAPPTATLSTGHPSVGTGGGGGGEGTAAAAPGPNTLTLKMPRFR